MSNSNFDKNGVDSSGVHWLQYAAFVVTAFAFYFGWAFLSPETMPYVFLQKDGWVYYERGSSPRRVYYFNTETWKEYD